MFFFFMNKRNRRVGSIKNELIAKSREAALAAVQIFNSPTFCFKSESYIVLMIIAWTYLLHAYYRREKIEYRYLALVALCDMVLLLFLISHLY